MIGRKEKDNNLEVDNIINSIKYGKKAMALNKDLTYPTSDNKQIPGNGAIVKYIEEKSKKSILSFGKPDELYTEYLLSQKYKISYVIGDRVDTDILLGSKIKAKTFLVSSSIDNYMEDKLADHKFNNFSESVSFILHNF